MLDKVSPGSVNWKQAAKPPIKMLFRKVENCNQVIRIGKQLKLSLVNVAGDDIVQGNKKLLLGNILDLELLLLPILGNHELLLVSALVQPFILSWFASYFSSCLNVSLSN